MGHATVVTLGARGALTIPRALCEALSLEVGAELEAEVVRGCLVLRPTGARDGAGESRPDCRGPEDWETGLMDGREGPDPWPA